MKNKLNNNIKLEYLYCFLKNIDMSASIWVLYLIYKGIPLWQIGLLEAIFHITSFLSELPTGAMADLFGRKKVLIIGRICSVIASILMILSKGFWGIAISFVFSAWGYNLNSGSEEALVYDTMKLLGREREYIIVNSRLNVIIEAVQGISVFIGGILAEYSYTFCYLAAVIITIISMLPAILFQEPELLTLSDSDQKDKNLWSHFKLCLETLKESKKIQNILFFYPITFTFYTVMYFYGQKYFSDYGLNKIQISIIMLMGGLVSCLGAVSCNAILKICKDKTKYITSISMGIAIMGLYFHNLTFAIVLFAISSYINALLYPIQSDSLNKLIPSEQRATIISVNSMLFSFMMILIFPLVGFIAETIGLNITFLLLGIFQLILVLLLLMRRQKNHRIASQVTE